MTENYLVDAANALNKTFQLYKAKLKDLPKKAETDSEVDKVSDWFGNTLNEFVDLEKSISDADVANFVSHFSIACLADLENKYEGKAMANQYRWLGKIDDIEAFITSCKEGTNHVGDCVKYKGVEIEVKRIDKGE